MTIPAGILSERVIFDTINPLAEVGQDQYGKRISLNGEELRIQTPRFAAVRGIIIDEESAPGVAFVKSGTLIITCRMDDFTRNQVNADTDVIMWNDDRFSIVSKAPNIIRRSVEFTATPTDMV